MYYVYMLRCADQSIYTGTASDVEKRYSAHISGRGAKYTKSHPPIRIDAVFECNDKAEALRLEYKIKRLARAKKEMLINKTASLEDLLLGDNSHGKLDYEDNHAGGDGNLE